jgi:hypothetical protein
MKLLEVAPDFVRSEVGTLMTILQYLESRVKPGTAIPMNNIVKLMNNAGYAFNFELLKNMLDDEKNKSLKDMIGDANETSITLGKETPDDDESLDNASPDTEKTVDKMASNASKF